MSKIYKPDCRGCAYNHADWFTRQGDECCHPKTVFTLSSYTRRNECGLEGKWFTPKTLNIVQRIIASTFNIPVAIEKQEDVVPYRVGSWAED